MEVRKGSKKKIFKNGSRRKEAKCEEIPDPVTFRRCQVKENIKTVIFTNVI